MKCSKGSRLRLLLVAVLLAMAALLVAGCGEEEKYNKEKAQILEELKQVQLIKVPANLEGEALDAAIDAAAPRHKAAVEQIESKWKAVGAK